MEESPQVRRPWLPDHFINQVLPHLVEKSLFGKKKIRFGPLFIEQASMYENGAVLGRARGDQVETLLNISIDNCDDMITGQAEYHLSLIQQNPDGAWGDLIWEVFHSRIPSEHRLEVLARNAKHEEDYDESILSLRLVFDWGVVFGAKFPSETESLYRKVHELGELSPRAAVPAFRLKAEPQPQVITLERWEEAILEETAIFVSAKYPELMSKLRL